MAREIDAEDLANIVAEQCDIENLCSDEVLDNFNQEDDQQFGTPSGASLPAGLASTIDNEDRTKNSRLLQNNDLFNPTSNLIDKGLTIDNRFLPSFDEKFSFGKKNKYIISDSLGLAHAEFLSSNPLEDKGVFNYDPYRGRLGSYWSLGPSALKIEFLRNRKEIVEKSVINYIQEPLLFSSFLDTEYEEEVNFGFLEETYQVEFKKQRFVNAKNIQARDLISSFSRGGIYSGSIRNVSERIEIEYPSTFVLNTDFFDIHYDFYSPYQEKDFTDIQTPSNSLVYKIEPDYNFYIKAYEDILNTTEIQEVELPSLYVLAAKEKFKSVSPNVERIFGLDKKINVKKLISNTRELKKIIPKNTGQYFEQFSTEFPKLSNKFKNENFSKLKNILFYSDKINDLLSLNDKKSMYPMYIDVKFSIDKTTKFADILKQTKLIDKMMSILAQKISTNSFEEFSFLIDRRDIARDNEISNLKEYVINNSIDLRAVDLNQIIQEIQDKNNNITNLKDTMVLAEYDSIEKTQTKEEKIFIDTLYFAIFKSKMVDLLRQKFRTHNDILKGRASYNETVFYRIAKYKGDTISGEPIQNIYFPNTTGKDYINYVDTQVKYDQKYTYAVYAYDLVIGNKYRYTDLEDGPTEEKKNYTVENEPYMYIVENPFFVQRANVYDSPPPPPEVNPIAYKDIDNKILIMLNSSTATYKKAPILLKQGDEQVFQKISDKQGIEFGQPIEFSSDDRIASYEIYRTDMEPASYDAFSESLIRKISTDVSLRTIQQASSAAFVDSIEPNKKYYYIFRAIDVHDKPSNPTEVYEVQMYSENGSVVPMIKSYDIKEANNKTPSKGVKRFIQIIPSVLQTILNENSEEYRAATNAEKAIKHVKLGITDNSVWDKKFKIRLVSKQTKKVLDFDVKFDFVVNKAEKNK
jgi:hypothetical protein